MRYLVCIVAALAALVIPASHADAAGNPCSLLSLGEAESITQLSLTSSKDNPLRADQGADKDTGCAYTNDDKNQSVGVIWHDSNAFFPGNAKTPNTEGYKRLSGIGDRAWSSANAMAVSIDILKNSQYVSVRITNPDGLKDRGAKNYAEALKLAKLVANRL